MDGLVQAFLKTRAHRLLAAMLAVAIAGPAMAETLRVDDSASQVLGGTLRLKPDAPFARGSQANLVSGEIPVLVRLDVSAWKGRQGRIYMLLPQRAGGMIGATWSTRGRLLPGTVRSGERTLVYAGLIQGDLLEDTLRLRIQADERTLARDERLAFAFEIDLGTP